MLVTVLMLAMTTGCEPTRTLVPKTEAYLQDVPVPTTFKFDPAHSSDLAGTDAEERFVNYQYTGRAYYTDVVAFYKRNMPIERWELKQELGTAGQKKLVFHKTAGVDATARPPRCIVTIIAGNEMATGIQILRMGP